MAADWDVLPPGTIVYIEGLGERIVEDKGGGVNGRHIDLYFDDLDTALEWGRQKRQVWIVKKRGETK
ncbi:3D domain-containing protein [Brevibacillus sp. CF112]|uniref:3D domain-containing protein n=1 Tax=Brevibacillus sp. CF112 TaxID=1144311 RepID=UPI00350FEA58